MTNLNAVPEIGVDAAGVESLHGATIPSELPDRLAGVKLSPRERKLWDHVTQSLHEYGLVHRTDAMLLTIICKTFARWAEAEEQLTAFCASNNGSYIVKTPNGYEQAHQIYFIARNLKRELLQWLPEAALTIPSFHKIMGDLASPDQGNLFEDPVEAHRQRRVAMGMRLVSENK